MIPDEAHTVIALLIFVCVLQIFILLRVTQTFWLLSKERFEYKPHTGVDQGSADE